MGALWGSVGVVAYNFYWVAVDDGRFVQEDDVRSFRVKDPVRSQMSRIRPVSHVELDYFESHVGIVRDRRALVWASSGRLVVWGGGASGLGTTDETDGGMVLQVGTAVSEAVGGLVRGSSLREEGAVVGGACGVVGKGRSVSREKGFNYEFRPQRLVFQ